jgi:type III secretion system low calcium response chaperone LcrH/SycD
MEQIDHLSIEDVIHSCQKTLGQQKTLAEVRGITNSMLEDVYRQGLAYYEEEQLEEATTYFTYLVMHQPWDQRFHMALGSVLHLQAEYTDALSFYGYALCLNACDPRPCFRIAECMLALGDTPAAIEALETAVSQSESNPDYAQIWNMANTLLEKLTSLPH